MISDGARVVPYLYDEEPSPACQTSHAIHLEDAQSDEACKGCGKDVASVENGDTGGDLLSSVEDREHEESTRIVSAETH